MVGSKYFEVEVQGRYARLILQHLDVRRFVYTCNGSEKLVLYRLERIDQSVSVSSFVPTQVFPLGTCCVPTLHPAG
jgi:hypothetical protein